MKDFVIRFLSQQVDAIKVVAINLLAFGITLTDVEQVLKIVALVISIGYGAYKWISDFKKNNNNQNTNP